jgi:hypothetical protein
MLPSLVVKIKQHWGLQQNGANLRHQESSLLIQFLSERNFRTPNRQVLDSLSERVSAGCDSQNTRRPTKKNEALWQRWSRPSNRFWVKNRSYRKQMIKPFLTAARTAFRKSPRSTRRVQATWSFHLKICQPLSLSSVSLHLNVRCSTSDSLRRCKMGRLKAGYIITFRAFS